ncbi:hypothetical protein HII28_00375 [Planctomonas sp. JC2975]|uniref:hypothetical protein n=1 Tax=Planctomonas sp. JC2975 TaxID=2729626 RepID=UPI0014747B58|nr:hypothetical protein [Planctomonas sp. JC2975]NNC10340.1 hypothetical protein [Planctomonas sp. JC2975]
MGAAISISVVSDTKSAVASVKNLSTEYGGLVDQLKKLGPDGAQAAEQLESSMKAAQLATQDAAKASQDLITQVNKAKLAAASGGLDLSKPMEATAGGIKKVNEEGSKLAEGLQMNAGFGVPMLAESLGSGQGGLAGAADAAAQAIGGMGMMMGPEVMVPAALLGGLLASIAGQLELTAEDEKVVTEMTADLAAAWEKAHPAGDKFSQALADWVASSKDYGIDLSNLERDTNAIGASFGDITVAMVAKSIPAMEAQKKVLAELTEKYSDQEHQLGANGGAYSKEMQQLASKQGAIKTVTKSLDEQIKAAEDAMAAEEAQASAMGLTVKQYENYSTASKKLSDDLDKKKSAVQGFTSALQSDLSSTGSSLDQILDRSKDDADKILTNQQKTLDANKRFLDDWNAAVKDGLDANGQAYVTQNRADFQEVVDTYGIDSPQSQQFIQNANALGAQTGSSFTGQFTSSVADAMVQAQRTMNAQKLVPSVDLSSVGPEIQRYLDNYYLSVDVFPVVHKPSGVGGSWGVNIG